MNAELQVRPIAPGDLDAVLALCHEHAAYERAEFRENGQVDRWKGALFGDRPALYGWVAVDRDVVCGYMTVTVDFATWSAEPFAYMDCLYIQERYRGHHLGRVFMARLFDFCVAHHCRSAEWQTPEDNQLGIGFYRHIGATAKTKARFSYEVAAGGTP